MYAIAGPPAKWPGGGGACTMRATAAALEPVEGAGRGGIDWVGILIGKKKRNNKRKSLNILYSRSS